MWKKSKGKKIDIKKVWERMSMCEKISDVKFYEFMCMIKMNMYLDGGCGVQIQKLTGMGHSSGMAPSIPFQTLPKRFYKIYSRM